MHNFYDSPHVFGKCYFQIFMIQNHIVKLSKKTNYEWYLNYIRKYKRFDSNKKFCQKIKIKLISSKINNNVIFNIGVNCVLTCFGS